MAGRIAIVTGDLTRLHVDAIVNAVNESLLCGGVGGAIHAPTGPGLLVECRTLGGCSSGEARLTGGYEPIIHTARPIWQGGVESEHALPPSCYEASLQIASADNFHFIAFPAISMGVSRFPAVRAVMIAVETVLDFLARHAMPTIVIFCCFSSASAAYHHAAIIATGEQK
jgi:O-acetyl-ADP-ribose deacetylase (regulator of RNase III)